MKKTQIIPFGLIIFIFLTFFLSAGAMPDQKSKDRKKDRKNEVRLKRTVCKRAPVKEYKKLTGNNKYLKRSRQTGY
ncbi:MAG: hypothetical protein Q8868_12395 [Bacteroidota bacterium]|nr:hypothetical protein [Bacteroidota bacterium]